MTCCACERRSVSRRENVTYVLLASIAVVALAIYVSVEFEAQVRRVNWSIVTGFCGGAAMVYVFWRWAVATNTIEPWDMILDPITRRLSLWRVLIAITFAVGIWILAQWQITKVPPDADKIIYLYSTIIGSLVAKVASGEWADVKANRQPVPADPLPAVPGAPAP